MTTANPETGSAAKKSSFDENDKRNVANPTDTINIFGRPSLTPGVEYPISDKAEKIRKAAYQQGYEDAIRMNRAGRIIEEDPFLDVLRQKVEEFRKEKIKSGEIEPINKRERKIKLGFES